MRGTIGFQTVGMISACPGDSQCGQIDLSICRLWPIAGYCSGRIKLELAAIDLVCHEKKQQRLLASSWGKLGTGYYMASMAPGQSGTVVGKYRPGRAES